MRAIAKVTSPVPLRYVLFLVVPGMLAAALTAGSMLSPGPAEAAFPGANGKIAFRSFRDGNGEIYVMNADGSAQTNLSNNPAEDLYPAWSPDGSKIAFSSDRDGDYEIYVMNADGAGQTQITNNTAYDREPAWSPDGSKIAFVRVVLAVPPYGSEIIVMNADGGAQTNVTNNGLSGVWNGDVDWSPDGSKIAFSRMVSLGESEVYVMNPDGSGQTNLTNNAGALEGSPTWSPDGSKMAYVGRGASPTLRSSS
jgi:TolB protein